MEKKEAKKVKPKAKPVPAKSPRIQKVKAPGVNPFFPSAKAHGRAGQISKEARDAIRSEAQFAAHRANHAARKIGASQGKESVADSLLRVLKPIDVPMRDFLAARKAVVRAQTRKMVKI